LVQLYEFGKKLRDVLELASGKIGVVSLGDMSRTAHRNREGGRTLDQSIIADLRGNNIASLCSRSVNEIARFSLGALSPLAIAKGLLDGVKHETDMLNYEQKYGVGMMAARFI